MLPKRKKSARIYYTLRGVRSRLRRNLLYGVRSRYANTNRSIDLLAQQQVQPPSYIDEKRETSCVFCIFFSLGVAFYYCLFGGFAALTVLDFIMAKSLLLLFVVIYCSCSVWMGHAFQSPLLQSSSSSSSSSFRSVVGPLAVASAERTTTNLESKTTANSNNKRTREVSHSCCRRRRRPYE
jgi:hypothetical protein